MHTTYDYLIYLIDIKSNFINKNNILLFMFQLSLFIKIENLFKIFTMMVNS